MSHRTAICHALDTRAPAARPARSTPSPVTAAMSSDGRSLVQGHREDKMDPILEISIDDRRTPAVVHLVGILDSTTSASLLSVMNDLFGEDVREFVFDLEGADITASGVTALTLCQRWARESGGSLLWSGIRFC